MTCRGVASVSSDQAIHQVNKRESLSTEDNRWEPEDDYQQIFDDDQQRVDEDSSEVRQSINQYYIIQ